MAILNFPDTTSQPTDGSFTYTENGVIYVWDGDKWAAGVANNLTDTFVNKDGDTMTGDLTVPNLISEGDVQTTSLNGGPLAGFRNQIINGDFRFWQRGETFGGFTYSADRWLTSNTNVTHSSVERIDTALVTGGNRQFMTSVELPFVGNPRAHGPGPFTIGSQWTISLYTTGTPQVRLGFTDNVLNGGSDVEVLADTSLTKTGKTIGILEQWSLTFTVNASPNATNPALRIVFTFAGDSQMTLVQLEPGPVATPFEQRPIGTELAMCQRYYIALSCRRETTLTWVSFPNTMRNVPDVANSLGDSFTRIYENGFLQPTGSSNRSDVTADAEL